MWENWFRARIPGAPLRFIRRRPDCYPVAPSVPETPRLTRSFSRRADNSYPINFFESVISAFRTRETGQPAFALSAISLNFASSIPGTLPIKSR